MTMQTLPDFKQICIKTMPSKLEEMLNQNLSTIESILTSNTHFNWDNLMHVLEDMDDELERFWSPFSHLHAVKNSPEIRQAYEACLPKLSSYEAAIGQNQRLYEAICSIDVSTLNDTRKKIIEDAIKGFLHSGVALCDADKKRFEAISTKLADLSNQFDNHILDATQAFQLHVTDKARLAGIPEHALHAAFEAALEKGLDGWLFNLEYPYFAAIITYAEDRALRQSMYEGWVTRASDQGPQAGQFDNSMIMNDILALRDEKAKLLGFDNYAELSIDSKMAQSTDMVLEFLNDLSSRAHQQAQSEFKRLLAFAREHLDMDVLLPWDVAYASEKKRQAKFTLSQEMLRPWFPVSQVLKGMFEITKRLYGVEIELFDNDNVWHQDVQCLKIMDEENHTRGIIYCDLYARSHKRGGAWMDSLQTRRKVQNGDIQVPIATLTCNFARASKGQEACLSHDEVLTLFHEFGHCLHHVLTKVDEYSVSGIHGVEWDAVELPSQFFENWCYEQSALELLSCHIETKESIGPDLFEKLTAARNFQSAMAMMRQLEFSLFDFLIHKDYQKQEDFISSTLSQVRSKTTVVPVSPINRFQHSFSHIFAGGYAAGYYSYKWAEVLSSDAFSRFEDEGIFNPHTGRDFLHFILEVGGSKKALDAFIGFRGRPAKVDALLRHNNIR